MLNRIKPIALHNLFKRQINLKLSSPVFEEKNMAQAQIGGVFQLPPEGEINIAQKKRKITFNTDRNHYISKFKNEK